MPFFGGGGGNGYAILTNNNIDGGDNVMANVTGINNIGIGNSALQNITTGSYNVAIGTGASQLITGADKNVIVGNGALGDITNLDGNTVIGYNALDTLTDADASGSFVYIGDGTELNGALFKGGRNSVIVGNQLFSGGNSLFYSYDSIIIGARNGDGAVDGGEPYANSKQFQKSVIVGAISFTANSLPAISVDNSIILGDCVYNYDFSSDGLICIGDLAQIAGVAGVDGSIVIGKNAVSRGTAIVIGQGSTGGTNSIVIGYGQTITTNAIKIGDIGHTGGVNIGPYDIDDIYNGVVPSCLFAALPGAGTVPVGARRYVTDIGVGGSYWFSDGTRWRAINDSVVLHNNYTDVDSVANTTEQILDQFLFPAGFLQVGDIIRVTAKLDKSSTVDTCSRRIRLGTAGTIADTLLTSVLQPQTTNRTFSDYREFIPVSATSVEQTTLPISAGYGTSTAITADVTISNIANALYLSYSTLMTTGAETMKLRNFVVELITAGA